MGGSMGLGKEEEEEEDGLADRIDGLTWAIAGLGYKEKAIIFSFFWYV
jgi:hypothetical protein